MLWYQIFIAISLSLFVCPGVIAGLDPAIHRCEDSLSLMDARVNRASTPVFDGLMPAHDNAIRVTGMLIRRLAIAALAAVLPVGAAQAQDYPSRPVRLIVPFAAGGGTDTISRIIAQALSEQLKGTVVVENVGGAGGSIGTAQVAKAAADGYTLLSATPSITINPHIQRNVAYSVLRDFVPVAQVTTSPAVLIANKEFPAKSVADLIALARAKPGKISYGSAGIGSFNFLAAELFKAMAGVDITHIPYRGTGPALIDLIGGRIEVQFENAPAVLGQIRNGELKAIAVGTAGRSAILPELPTIADTVPGYESSSWLGLLAPAATPRPVIERLNAAINKALADEAIRKRLDALGVERAGGRADAFGAYLRAKVEETDRIAKTAGLKPE
jgi:tripartite-type tricarboxylate transporter receptor subunit TctC